MIEPDFLERASLGENIEDTWLYYDGPIFGVASIDNQKFLFNAYEDNILDGGRLFFYASIEEETIGKLETQEITVRDAYSLEGTKYWLEKWDGNTVSLAEADKETVERWFPRSGVFLKSAV